MEVAVRAVANADDVETWITFPRRSVYSRTSPWVPPLDADLRRALDRRKNPFFRYGQAVALLAFDRATGHTLGRTLAHVWNRHNALHAERTSFFGFFECLNVPAAASALVGAAAEFGLGDGCTTIRGPFNMTAMQEMGILVDGFDAQPAVDQTYTPAYYPTLLQGAGLTSTFPVSTFRVDDLRHLNPNALLGPKQHALLESGAWTLRPARRHDVDRELETLRELLNESFHANPHFVPITSDEFDFQLGPYKQFLDYEICRVAELHGVPMAFVVAVPDFNPVLRLMRGRINVRGVLEYLRTRGRMRQACLIIMGVHPAYQGKGVMRMLQADFLGALIRRRYQHLTITWVADVNTGSLATVRALGARVQHRLCLYEAAIERLVSPSPAYSTVEAR